MIIISRDLSPSPLSGYTDPMDPVTHIVSGALGGRALRDRFPTRLVYALCILAAWIPDIDNFVGLGPEEYLLHHRGITHSVLGILVQALLLTGVFRLFGKTFPPLKTFLAALGLLTLHVWLDVVTTYGTQVLAPFDTTRYQWGSVFIIDPLLTLSLITLFFLSLRRTRRAKTLAALGLALCVAYPLACHGVKATVTAAMPGRLAAQNLAGRDFEISTDALSPLYWKVLVTDGDTLLVGSTSALPGNHQPIAFQTFTRADQDLLHKLAAQAHFFQTWNWFAMYPTMQDVPVPAGETGERAILFTDARFLTATAPLQSLLSSRATPFQITAILDASGNLTSFIYNHHSATTVYSVTN